MPHSCILIKNKYGCIIHTVHRKKMRLRGADHAYMNFWTVSSAALPIIMMHASLFHETHTCVNLTIILVFRTRCRRYRMMTHAQRFINDR